MPKPSGSEVGSHTHTYADDQKAMRGNVGVWRAGAVGGEDRRGGNSHGGGADERSGDGPGTNGWNYSHGARALDSRQDGADPRMKLPGVNGGVNGGALSQAPWEIVRDVVRHGLLLSGV